jgi:hypothetical protein
MDFNHSFAASTRWIAAASLVLTACTTVAPLEYPPDHPANPAAPAAAAEPPLTTLMAYKSFAGAAEPETDASPSAVPGEGSKTEQPNNEEGAHEHRH